MSQKGQHSKAEGQDRRGRSSVILLATGVVVIAAAGGLAAAITSGPGRHLLAIGSPGEGGGVVATTAVPATTGVPLPKVVSVSPRPGSSGVGSDTPITIVLSRPPAPGAPVPTLTPAVPGQWSVNGRTLTFIPTQLYQPWSEEDVTVPRSLADPETASFNVQGVPILRTEQLLAELGYLPVNFTLGNGQAALSSEPTVASEVSPAALAGSFSWRFSNVPSSLSSLWVPGQDNTVLQGAVMQFESNYGLTDDGVVGPQVWKALTQAVATRQVDGSPYDYLVVSEAIPEQLSVWRDGSYIYSSPANTGVTGAVTATGTFPVYSRFQTTTMTGTDPDGYHYVAPDVPWVAYFNGGDAVHGYPRASYGFPQSNGCVELPISNAEVVWAMDPIGTLVTVE
ncbi:MAG TPA: L,D-transpeptidase family protein [Acidimicrobiales bacterium]|nr:L,D-transpeptidase family protein [Acidimicrobiales bacterium]